MWNRKHRLYDVWTNIKQRTTNPRCKYYYQYGGRGIDMSPLWFSSFGDFALDVATLPGYAPGLSLDRIDNNRGYHPLNVRWVSMKQQNRNRRSNRRITFRGETLLMCEWADRLQVTHACLQHRLGKLGWSVEKALNEPHRYAKHRAGEHGVHLEMADEQAP